MNSKQLADVLTKMLGLSMGIYAIPGFIAGLITAIISPSIYYPTRGSVDATWANAIINNWRLVGTCTIQLVFAILLVAKSEWVATKLFPTENADAPTPPPAGVS